MPEELNKTPPGDSVFDDLPPAQTPNPAPPAEEKPIPAKEEDKDYEIQQLRSRLTEKDKIAKEERRKRKEMSERLREATAAKPDEKPKEDGDDDDIEPQAQPAPANPPAPQGDIVAQVKASLRTEMYEDEMVKYIRARPGITREEAKEAYATAKKLPRSGNPQLDADFAFDYVSRVRESERGFVPPSPSAFSGGMPAGTPANQLPKTAVAYGKEHYKLTDEDYKKYDGNVRI